MNSRREAPSDSTKPRALVQILGLTSFAIILDGFDSQALGFALPAMIADWGLPKAAFAPVLSVSLIGMSMGSAFAGALGDRLGRKALLVGCVALFGAMTALTALADGLWSLAALRFLAAAGLGGAMPNAAALIGEAAPAKHRSLAISSIAVCVPLGGVLGGLVAAGILPAIGWQGLFLVAGAIPCAYAAVLAIWLPESSAFRRSAVAPDNVGKGGVGALFAAGNRSHTLLLSFAFFFCLLNVYACFNWLPTLIVGAGHPITVASFGLTLFNLGGVAAAVSGGWATGRFGSRRPLVCMFALSVVFSVALAQFLSNTILMLTLLTVLGACIAGAQSVLTAVAAQSYPATLRSSGIGVTIGFGRLGGIASAFAGAAALRFGATSFAAMIAVAAVAGLLTVVAFRRHLKPTSAN